MRIFIFLLFLSLSGAAGFLIRGHFFLPVSWANFHADHAIFGLMAKDFLRGEIPIFFYGQNYLGSIEAISAALIASFYTVPDAIREAWPFPATVSPYHLSIAASLWFAIAAALGTALIYRIAGIRVAIFWGLVATIGSWPLIASSATITGIFSALALGILLLHILLLHLEKARGQIFCFALVLGIGWWTNQTIVFFALPAIVYWIWHAGFLQSRMWKAYLEPAPWLRPLYAIAALGICFGFYIDLFAHHEFFFGEQRLFKIPNGTKSAKDFLLGIGLIQMLYVVFQTRKRKDSLIIHELRGIRKPLLHFGAGFLIGYFPVWAGKIFGWYPGSYGVDLSLMPLAHLPGQTFKLFTSFAPKTIASGSWFATLVGVVLIVYAFREKKKLLQPTRCIFLISTAGLILNFAYFIGSARSLGGLIHYVFPSFVFFWILVAIGLGQVRQHAFAAIGATICLLALAFPIYQKHEEWADKMNSRDARARIENLQSIYLELEASGLRYCWGDYWTAYLMTYLSDERIILSPHPEAPAGQIRIPRYKTLLLDNNPECYVYRVDERANSKIALSRENPWR